MSLVYVSVRLIVAPGAPEQILDVLEFKGAAWEVALQAAYDWLLVHRMENCVYNVYC